MEYDGLTTWNGITRVREGVQLPRVIIGDIVMKYDVKITLVEGTTVHGTCDGKPFKAAPFFWGGKTLLKVVPEFYSQFGQGQKVAIGQAAKAVLRAGGTEIPAAPPSTRTRKEPSAPVPNAEIEALKAQLAALTLLLTPPAPAAEVAPEPEAEAEPEAEPEAEVKAPTARGRRK